MKGNHHEPRNSGTCSIRVSACSALYMGRIQESGRIEASAIDRKDGFFHLSPREDVCETATLYFPGRDMMAIEWPTSVLGEGLRYEPVPARGDRLFPHLYGTLPQPEMQPQRCSRPGRESALSGRSPLSFSGSDGSFMPTIPCEASEDPVGVRWTGN